MENGKKRADLSWQEKREERFKRWLSPPDMKFVNPEAKKLYQTRVTRFIKAIKMEEPDRVPVVLPVGNYPACIQDSISNHDVRLCRDAKSWIKYMDDFGDMDSFSGPP
jgi:hypothetical protein